MSREIKERHQNVFFIICYLFFLVQSSPNLTKSLFFDSQVGAFLKIEIAHHAPEMIENL